MKETCLSRYEQSLLDAKEGRVHSYESSEDFFKKMGMGDDKTLKNRKTHTTVHR